MNRVVASIPVGLILCGVATPAFAQPLGALLPGFNGGRPWFPGAPFAEQSYFHLVAPNLGPQYAGQPITFGGYAKQGGVARPAVASVAQAAPLSVPTTDLSAEAKILGEVLFPQSELIQSAIAYYAGFDVVAGNLRKSDGNYDAHLFIVDTSRSPNDPLSLKASLKLNPANVASEEVTSLYYGRLPLTSVAAAEGPSFYFSTARKLTDDCHVPVIGKTTRLDASLALGVEYRSDALGSLGTCYTKSIRVKPNSTWPGLAPVDQWERHLFAGARCRDSATTPEQVCLAKFLDGMTGFTLDTGFGGDGQVVVRHPTGGTLRYWDHAIGPDGRVTVSAGLGNAQGAFTPILFRLNADGSGDPTFGTNGVLAVPATGLSTNPRTLTIDYNYNYQLTGETYTASSVRPFAYFHTKAQVTAGAYEGKYVEYDFAGHSNSGFFVHHRHPDGTITAAGATYGNYPDTGTMRPFAVQITGPAAALPAIQYYHGQYQTYVTVANPDEVGKLDRREFPGWDRTGAYFHVLPTGTAGAFGVERFYSEGYAISSHFFPATAAEAAAVRLNHDWGLEGTVFGAWQPDAEGRCPPSLRGVSRVFRAVSGLPNHWYGQERVRVGQLVAGGGTLEGFGAKGFVYCAE